MSPSLEKVDQSLSEKHLSDMEYDGSWVTGELPNGDLVKHNPTRLSDVNLASRKAEETAMRRYMAVSWLQEIVGPIDLPHDASEEELRISLRNGLILCNLANRIRPGAIPKVIENPTLITSTDAALSAYQYFENVRNFLRAVEEMNLPTFEVSDLEQSLVTGATSKVVDCILALKSFYEWKQRGGTGQWRFGGVTRSLIHADSGRRDSLLYDEADWTASSLHQLCFSFLEVQTKVRDGNNQNFKASNGVENGDSQSLSKIVQSFLAGKHLEEIPSLVEFMLKKVIHVYKQQFLIQKEEMKNLTTALREISGGNSMIESNMNKWLQDHKDAPQVVPAQLQLVKELKETSDAMKQEVLEMNLKWKQELQDLESRLQVLTSAAVNYHHVLTENRRLYNEVQDLKGNIRVFCRIRPFLAGEAKQQETVDYIGENGEIMILNPKKQGKDARKSFNFNKVFGPSASQEEVFLDTRPLIRSVLDGYNVCIFAYGQTGAGKTFTMSGPADESEGSHGVNYRSLEDLFHISRSRKDDLQYIINVQMMEIYNEQVRDLLSTDGTNKKLEIRNFSQQNGMNVPDASMHLVNSTSDVLELMKTGQRNRSVGSTVLNERSSRSHSILTIHVHGKDLVSGSSLRGCLHLVDLAGSERVNKSEAAGDRLKEAQHINKSLAALGDVISALVHKSNHIPYRNSKLTQLLQDALGGKAKTLMFVHISPEAVSYEETLSTLKFAERVACVELGAAHTNKESGEIRDLKEQISALKDALAKKELEVESFKVTRNNARTYSRRSSTEDSHVATIGSPEGMDGEAAVKSPMTSGIFIDQKKKPVNSRQPLVRSKSSIATEDCLSTGISVKPKHIKPVEERIRSDETSKAQTSGLSIIPEGPSSEGIVRAHPLGKISSRDDGSRCASYDSTNIHSNGKASKNDVAKPGDNIPLRGQGGRIVDAQDRLALEATSRVQNMLEADKPHEAGFCVSTGGIISEATNTTKAFPDREDSSCEGKEMSLSSKINISQKSIGHLKKSPQRASILKNGNRLPPNGLIYGNRRHSTGRPLLPWRAESPNKRRASLGTKPPQEVDTIEILAKSATIELPVKQTLPRQVMSPGTTSKSLKKI